MAKGRIIAGVGIIIGTIIGAIVYLKRRPPPGPPVPVCTPGETRCVGGNLEICNAQGQWELQEENSPSCITPTTGMIQGHIINYNTGVYVPNAKMTVDNELIFYSRGDGSYSISDLSYGRHYIVIEAEGYRTVTHSADVSQEVQNVDFKMVPLGHGGVILEFSVDPTQIYQQEAIVVQTKIENTGDAGELFYARIRVNDQWSGSIISKWLEPGETYDSGTHSVTLFNQGTFTVTCELTGYEKEDVRDRASIQVTVLPKEIPNMLTLEPSPVFLFDRSRHPEGFIRLDFPEEANPWLLPIPKAYFKGTELAMDIEYSLQPNKITTWRQEREGWYWELFIFNEGDVYNFPFYPDRFGGTRPSWYTYFGGQGYKPPISPAFLGAIVPDQALTAASISGWEPLQVVDTGIGRIIPGYWPPPGAQENPPTDLYPESEGWFFDPEHSASKTFWQNWVALRYLKDARGRHPVVIRVMWYPQYGGNVAGYEDLWRAWKVGEIVVP